MRILVTGSQGFLGKNILAYLTEFSDYAVTTFNRQDLLANLDSLISNCDFIFHLAGDNRPSDPNDLHKNNTQLTTLVCLGVKRTGRKIPILFTSSMQANLNNPYGKSKFEAENILQKFHEETNNPVFICRLPGVFGKWCRPNYNSVVATFCHNIANNIPIQINNQNTKIELVYVDDVIQTFIGLIKNPSSTLDFINIKPCYSVTVGELAFQISKFKESRNNLIIEKVGNGFIRALYSTYLSYIPPKNFSYDLISHSDSRGSFVEFLKTPECGQFSYFTAYPGVTRGGHYHHTKTEKFLVVSGSASFKFRHIVTNQEHEILASGNNPKIVETIPGWAHNITNIGDEMLVVMLWANEIFDPDRSDTFSAKV